VGLAVLLLAAGAARGEPPKAAAPPAATERRAAAAAEGGLKYLYAQQRADATWPSRYTRRYPGGVESLVVLAALSSGEDAAKPPIAKSLAYVNELWPDTVFARAVRAMVYARLPGEQYAERLAKDLAWLVKNQGRFGGWGYGPAHPTTRQRPDWIDNANTQAVMQAFGEAAGAGAVAPDVAWQRARSVWLRGQNADGGWGFTPPTGSALRLRGSSYGSMTACGVATSFILAAHFAGEGGGAGPADVAGEHKAVRSGLAWLAKKHALETNPGWVWGEDENWAMFYLWGLGRAANAAGLRQLGGRPWAQQMAARLLDDQRKDGSWDAPAAGGWDPVVRTCFALLALAHARRPVLLNRIVLPGPGGEAADAHWLQGLNLADWFGGNSPARVTWQAVGPDASAETLAEAPLLLIDCPTGADIPKPLAGPIEHFVRRGGTVLVQVPAADVPTRHQCRDFFLGVFPDYRAADLADDHPLFSARFPLPPAQRPRLTGIGDRCRTRVLLLPGLADQWHAGGGEKTLPAFRLFSNVVLYATDGEPPPGRLSASPAPALGRATSTLRLARVKHDGDWNTNPLAFAKLNRTLVQAYSIGLEAAPPADLREKVDPAVTVLWLTGSEAPTLTGAEQEHLKAYVAAGGTLFIDPAVGDEKFYAAMQALLARMFGGSAVRPLAQTHPLITGEFGGGVGSDVRRVAHTKALERTRPGLDKPLLWGVELDGRLAVVLSRYGVTCPLEGYPTYGCLGLGGEDARRLAANVLLYAASRR
jgi:hypothetical protein